MHHRVNRWKRSAVAIAAASAALAFIPLDVAHAQSNTTGTIYGTVPAPTPDTEVLVESPSTGLKRSLKPDADGRFSFLSLPPGRYRVSLLKQGKVVARQDDVEVRLAQGIEVSLAQGATQVVEITARVKRLDVSTAGSTTVFSATELAQVPIANNVAAIIQLAPNTTAGDTRYGGANAPSFGGASASENAYYINGFPVTTLLTQVGFSQLPFAAIGQAQILTGGYGAEFGRSTGGVVNIVTKRGGNQWAVGGAVSYEPSWMRARERDQYYADNGTALANKLYFYNGLNKQDRLMYSAYGGGPLIKDKLFIFFAAEQNQSQRDYIRLANNSATYTISPAVQSSSFQQRNVSDPRYLLKLDWAISDNHTLEYTAISDQITDDRKYYGFNYATLARTNVQNSGQKYYNWGPTPAAAQQGARVDILKYSGYLSDDLTVTALYGESRTEHKQTPVGYNPAFPQIICNSAVLPSTLSCVNNQTLTGNLLVPGAFDSNKGGRFDFEYKLTANHTVRAGIDYQKITSLSGAATAGGIGWQYFKATDPSLAPDNQTAPPNSVTGNPLAQQGYYAQRFISSTGARPTVIQDAQYIEDRWQVTPRLLLTLGLRNEGFDNRNGDGKSYIKLTKQLAPRLAAAWDVNGDASMKVFGTAGRYHVPVPTNVAIRGAGSSLNAQQNYVYTGVDPATGAPTGLTAISPFYSPNNELGQAKNPLEVAAQNLKGNYQDELTLGIEKALARGWNSGAKFTYRTLRTAIDDTCDDRPFRAWAARNGVDASNWGFNCALYNPGLANTFNIDLNGDGKLENIPLSAADLGEPKVARKYIALDLFAEHPFDGKWWGRVTYTLAHNFGNAEGQLLSDIGQGDVSTTQAWDFPEFAVGANGSLPNNRTHQIKAFGFYQVTEQVGVGGNLVFSSGRPKNCIGNAPSPVTGSSAPYTPGAPVTNYSGYGSAYFFCNGQPTPRGSKGTLPPEYAVSLNVAYTPSVLPGLRLRADVFNVLNRQVAQVIEERYNSGTGLRTTYNTPLAYSDPRSVKFTISYDKQF
ncbi:MAG: TonB-dependent receptor [Burkholderiales bacterium]|nr:TonB-dependent receptor [Burkholderiales bacterium]